MLLLRKELQKLLKSLNPSKALGPDELHPRVLKELAIELRPHFAHLFHQSVDNNEKFRSFKSQENIHKKEVWPYPGFGY